MVIFDNNVMGYLDSVTMELGIGARFITLITKDRRRFLFRKEADRGL